MNEIENLEHLLADFIAAVHRVEWKPPMAVMNFFPTNCCSVASFFLGNLLQARGLGKWHIVNGVSANGNHDWLRSESGIRIDATSHQFGVEPFVALGPSPLEETFQPQQVIALTRWTQAHRDAYAMLLPELPPRESCSPHFEGGS
ncbi:hypothetical protein F8G81_07515 [Arthrobacter sp. CDRTa11]|uniref:hypothetical protein n=1 Tax=Arthrobacter sp. CDRTa11 TaxID=2651199 RepID=UPI002265CC22|nr:hypothetical protein [Arthrobacter sp. CDRTa11]UZX02481.1 hypothetical protein F8G81_07515 [Arthrobacter sp. CDRTa11]